VTWLKRQETVEGKGLDQVRMRLRSYRGTMGELLSWVEDNYKEVLHHKWRVKYLRHQFHLEAEYFEPTSAVVLADFASAMVGRIPMLLHESRLHYMLHFLRFLAPGTKEHVKQMPHVSVS